MSSQASRFTGGLAPLIAGGLTVIFAFALRPRTEAWLSFALSASVLVVVLAAFAMPDQGAAARVLDVLLAFVCAWSIVASRAFGSSHVLKWLCFADGAATSMLGVGVLIAHEAAMERRLRRFEEDQRHRWEMTRRGERETAGRWFG